MSISCDTINVITRAQRIFYLENGYLIVEDMLSTEKLENVRDAVEKRYVLEGSQAGSEAVSYKHLTLPTKAYV